MIRRHLLLFLSAWLIVSCSRTEEVVIEGNQAPPDNTIENVILENYINKLYISLLGRKVNELEYSSAYNLLEDADMSIESREQLIDLIHANPQFHVNEYELARADLLNGVDTNSINSQIDAINAFLTTLTDSAEIQIYENARDDLLRLTTVPSDLDNEIISMSDMHRFCVDNFAYDEINMGTENFIVSIYQNFFYRYPTEEELVEASKSVDGFQGIVFYQILESKQEFIDAFVETEEYFEGQVRSLYLRYLFREPTAEEMTGLAYRYQNGETYKNVQKSILIIDEYVGL